MKFLNKNCKQRPFVIILSTKQYTNVQYVSIGKLWIAINWSVAIKSFELHVQLQTTWKKKCCKKEVKSKARVTTGYAGIQDMHLPGREKIHSRLLKAKEKTSQ